MMAESYAEAEVRRLAEKRFHHDAHVRRQLFELLAPLVRGAEQLLVGEHGVGQSEPRWEQAIAMEELAEPQCFTTEAHREAVGEMLAAGR
jgi:hypothetical protein